MVGILLAPSGDCSVRSTPRLGAVFEAYGGIKYAARTAPPVLYTMLHTGYITGEGARIRPPQRTESPVGGLDTEGPRPMEGVRCAHHRRPRRDLTVTRSLGLASDSFSMAVHGDRDFGNRDRAGRADRRDHRSRRSMILLPRDLRRRGLVTVITGRLRPKPGGLAGQIPIVVLEVEPAAGGPAHLILGCRTSRRSSTGNEPGPTPRIVVEVVVSSAAASTPPGGSLLR